MKSGEKDKFSFLIADDDPDDQYLIQKVIREFSARHTVAAVYNGLQLMDYLLRRGMYVNCMEPEPDCVLLDLKMPLLNGTEALKRIRNYAEFLNLPVFILSEKISEQEQKGLLSLGANGFFAKKSEPASFQLIVKEILLSIGVDSKTNVKPGKI